MNAYAHCCISTCTFTCKKHVHVRICSLLCVMSARLRALHVTRAQVLHTSPGVTCYTRSGVTYCTFPDVINFAAFGYAPVISWTFVLQLLCTYIHTPFKNAFAIERGKMPKPNPEITNERTVQHKRFRNLNQTQTQRFRN